MKSVILMLAILILAACNGPDKLSFDSVESARKQANENAEYNAQAFRQQHAEYNGAGISMRGDSTQSSECGQGDGWATIDLVQPDGTKLTTLKCSTASGAIGCMTADDFKSRPYAKEDGKCNAEIPYPLPKILK